MKDPRITLQEHLSERIATNPNYSLRAFARDLGLSPQLLSNFINGKKGMSERMAAQVADRLGLSHAEREFFFESTRSKFSRNKATRVIAKAKLAHLASQAPLPAKSSTELNLELDLFKIISNWYHLALVELLKISPKNCKTDFLAKRLGIPEIEVRLALSRLERLELITKTPKGYQANQDSIIADRGIATEAIRNYHRQILAKANHAVDTHPDSDRYGSSSLLPMKATSLAHAKKLIQKFRQELSTAVVDTENGDEVFALSIQLFQISESEDQPKIAHPTKRKSL